MAADNGSSTQVQPRAVSLDGGNLNDLQSALLLTFVTILVTFTVASNSFVIRAISNFPPLKNPSNLLLLSLAITDLLSAVVAMPVACYYNISGVWHFGKTACQTWLFMTIFLCFSSMFHLCAIAIDRYRAIATPLTYAMNRSNRKSVYILCIVWSVSFLSASVPFPFPWGMRWPEVFLEDTPCAMPMDDPYRHWIFFTMFIIPLFILIVTYAKFYGLNKRRHQLKINHASKLLQLKQSSTKLEDSPNQTVLKGDQRDEKSTKLDKYISIDNTGLCPSELLQQQQPASQQGTSFQQKDIKRTLNSDTEGKEIGLEHYNPGPEIDHSECKSEITVEESKLSDEDIIVNDDEADDGSKHCYEFVEFNHETNVSCYQPPASCYILPVKCMVTGSKRRQILNNLTMDLNISNFSFSVQRCQRCEAGLPKTNKSGTCQICSAPNDLILAAEKSRLEILVQKERRSMFIFTIIVCTFVISWSPSFIMLLFAIAFPSVQVAPWMHFVGWWLFYSNSACNPIIYTIFNSDFKQAFTKMVKRT